MRNLHFLAASGFWSLLAKLAEFVLLVFCHCLFASWDVNPNCCFAGSASTKVKAFVRELIAVIKKYKNRSSYDLASKLNQKLRG